MFNSLFIDVAIALVTVYLTLALLVTSVNELIANWCRSRAKHLENGIKSLLLDKDGSLTQKLYSHPLIRGLVNLKDKAKAQKPSYIPARTFAMALLDILSPAEEGAAPAAVSEVLKKIPNIDLKKALTTLAAHASGDLEKFRRSVEIWFDNGMERVSGWYKRNTQWVTLWLGLVIVLALNLDTIKICRVLANAPAVRAALVAQGEEYAKRGPLKAPSDVQTSYQDVNAMGIPSGWSSWEEDFLLGGAFSPAKTLEHCLGWLLTAAAISLGAPFWFDILNKFINIRSAGRAPEEAPRAPKRLPPASGAGEPPPP